MIIFLCFQNFISTFETLKMKKQNIPPIPTKLSAILSTIIDGTLYLDLLHPLSLYSITGVIQLDWETILHSVDDKKKQRHAWRYGYTALDDLYRCFHTIPESVFCVAALEVNTQKNISKKRPFKEAFSPQSEMIEFTGDNEQEENENDPNDIDSRYGLPLLRFCLYCTSYDGTRKDWREIVKILNSRFPDVTILHPVLHGKTEEEKKTIEEKSLKRMLRSHSHSWSSTILNRSLRDESMSHTMLTWHCFCSQKELPIHSFLENLEKKGELHLQYYDLKEQECMENEENTFIGNDPLTTPNHITKSLTSTILAKNQDEQFILHVICLMKHDDILYSSRTGQCYIKQPNAMSTYRYYMSLREQISHWTTEKFQQTLEREKKEILPKEVSRNWRFQVIRHGPKFLRSIHQIGGEFLPLYEPNENYVEFNDGFYEISTGNLLLELDEDIVCFCYFPLSFERNVNVCPPKRWLSILENSLDEVLVRNFCQQYALLFRGPKQRRNRCLNLVGESQCGKSSLLAPLEGIFGRENIGITSRDKKFSLEDLVGKRIGILDEFSRNQLSREDFLLLAEGQPMKISMKYQKNPRMNTPPKYPKDNSGAVKSRLSVFRFYRLSTKSIDIEAISKIKDEEAAHVLVYCNKMFLEEKRSHPSQQKQ
jgi:hypothetical protein